MTAYRTVRLLCNGRVKRSEQLPDGIPCSTEFASPEASFESSIAAVRRLAAKAGWTYVPYQSRNKAVKASLDADYCPACKPCDGEAGHA